MADSTNKPDVCFTAENHCIDVSLFLINKKFYKNLYSLFQMHLFNRYIVAKSYRNAYEVLATYFLKQLH